jgi:putative spermidine/putrescine transport system substrate-binding protein
MTKLTKWVALGAVLALPGVAMARDLTVVSWGGVFQDAQRAVYFDPFKAETGTALAEDSWDGGVGALRSKAEAGEANTWDVIQVEGDEQQIGCEEGFLEPLDMAKLGGAEKFLPNTVFDCGIPANVYAMVMAYDGDKFPDGPKTWADFWDVEKFPGKRALRQGAKMNLEFALMADGVAKEDVYNVLSTPEGVDQAFKKLDELKPNIVWWTSGNQPMQLLGSGEVAMTTTYHTRVIGANKSDGKNFKLSYDGAMFLVDSWVIMKGSPNLDAAYALLNSLSDPDKQATWPDQLGGGVGVVAAQAKLDPALAASLPSSPENMAVELPLDVDFWIKNVDALNTRFAAWSGN